MQIKYPHCRFCRLDPTRDELSPQAAERFDKLALFERLRRDRADRPEGGGLLQSHALPLEAALKIRAVLARFEHFYNAYWPHHALGQMTPM